MHPIEARDLSPEEMIGECIMPRLKIEQFQEGGEYAERIRALILERKVGGFCIFGGNPGSVTATIHELQQLAGEKSPLLFSADCEFGLPMRLSEGGTEFPDAMAIAQTGDPQNAFLVAKAIAKEMRAIGIAWNFAPVADVNSNPQNPIINTRSFGEKPSVVSEYAVQYTRGLSESGIASTAKHFPGHGDTSKDSHRELPFVEGGLDRFEHLELPPFCALIQAGVDSIMPGHLAAPELARALGANDHDARLPATLSSTLVGKLLRDRLRFDGVIVTDALDMHAITDLYGSREAMVMAFQAGVDVLLLPADPESTYEALIEAFKEGKISRARLQQSVNRLSVLKSKYAISSMDAAALSRMQDEHWQLALSIARKALSVNGTFDATAASLLIIADDRTQAISKALKFRERVASPFQSCRLVMINEWSDAEPIDANTVIATFHRARGYIDGVVKEVTMNSVLSRIASRTKAAGFSPRGIIAFGSPYVDQHFNPQPTFTIKTFSESLASVEAVADLISKGEVNK